jgi:hypothetical protein
VGTKTVKNIVRWASARLHKTKQNKTKQNKTKQNKTKQNKTKQKNRGSSLAGGSSGGPWLINLGVDATPSDSGNYGSVSLRVGVWVLLSTRACASLVFGQHSL